jgi:hypothetical protein
MHAAVEAPAEFFQCSENEYLPISIYYDQNKEQIPEALAPLFPAFRVLQPEEEGRVLLRPRSTKIIPTS